MKIKLGGKHGVGKYATVDKDDYLRANKYSWTLGKNGYVYCYEKKMRCLLHRYILNVGSNIKLDHIDNNPLNNRKSNLRIATSRQNSMNSKKRKLNKNIACTSIYKGVYYDRWNTCAGKNWVAQITTNKRKRKTIGYFPTEEEAARAYNEMAIKYYGSFANPNNVA